MSLAQPPAPAVLVHASSPSPSSPPHLKDTETVPLHKKVIFSGLSGAIATTCIYPLAITKTKLQAEAGVQRTSPLRMMRHIRSDGGFRGFYRGWPPNVVLVMPEKAIKLTMNDFFKRLIKQRRGGRELTFGWEMAAGGLAGMVQVIATNPMELLQIQGATMADRIQRGQLKAALSYPALVRQLGLSGMYTGVFATLARDIPFSMLYFSLYSEAKRALLTPDTSPSMLGFKSFAAGAIAGTVAAAATCPLDVVKTRVHAEAAPVKQNLPQFLRREVRAWNSHFQQIVRVEGVGALFRGIVPRCIIISPLFGITMTCYEEFQQQFG